VWKIDRRIEQLLPKEVETNDFSWVENFEIKQVKTKKPQIQLGSSFGRFG
jgi:hypothetical protein